MPRDPVTTAPSLDTNQRATAPVRLFEIDYQCGICGSRHTAESYFTSTGDTPHDLDSLRAGVMATLKDETTLLVILKAHATVHHHDAGDLRHYRVLGLPPEQQTYTRLGITMTGEDGFICDECNVEFPTLADRWLHMGRHPRNGHRIGTYACAPNA